MPKVRQPALSCKKLYRNECFLGHDEGSPFEEHKFGVGWGWVRIGFKLVGQGGVSMKMCKARSFRGEKE